MSSIALVDCNNFFASCEQVFNPKLCGKPLVILSSNDGCIVARSQEAKALGIPMGAPAFQHRGKAIELSSNFTLYGDMSNRVMRTLETFGFPVDVYSIDEAFLTLPTLTEKEYSALGQQIRARIKQWLSLPIAIGIGPTKTLAKAANKIAKKEAGVCIVSDALLARLPVEDIWGVGRALSAALNSHGIYSALQLKECSEEWVKNLFGVQLLRTQLELRGIACSEGEVKEELPKSMISSRSFGRALKDLSSLKEAVASHAVRLAERLREEELLAGFLSVYIVSRDTAPSAYIRLPLPSSYTPDLIHFAHQALAQIFREGTAYKKAGIILSDLLPAKQLQLDFFSKTLSAKQHKLMHTLDAINDKFGKKTLSFAAEGTDTSYAPRSSNRSPRFTTCWDDLPIVLV